jgi:23S rRNA (adenine2030-N6)-methyltransferase
MKSDYTLLPEKLAGALRRFPTGLYIIWYPLLGRRSGAEAGNGAEGGALRETLLGLYGGNRCAAELRTVRPPAAANNGVKRMYGSGLVIYNPPWTLRKALEESLPVLAALLGGEQGEWDLWWPVDNG